MAESGKSSTAATIGAVATLITAIGGLIAVLNQTGFFDSDAEKNVEATATVNQENLGDFETLPSEPGLPVAASESEEASTEDLEIFAEMEALAEALEESENGMDRTERSVALNQTLIELAREVNQICPYMVDQVTRLDNASPMPNNAFQYNYTLINIDKALVDLNYIRNYLNTYMVNMVKTSPDLQFFRDNSVTLIYSYKDMYGNFLTSLRVTPEMYRN